MIHETNSAGILKFWIFLNLSTHFCVFCYDLYSATASSMTTGFHPSVADDKTLTAPSISPHHHSAHAPWITTTTWWAHYRDQDPCSPWIMIPRTWPAHKHTLSVALHKHSATTSLIARFMGPACGLSGADRTQVGPIVGPRNLAIWDTMEHALNYSNIAFINTFWHHFINT